MYKALGVTATLFCVTVLGLAQRNLSSAVPTAQSPAMSWSAIDEGLIKVDVEVTDKSGKPISGLTKQDFTLLEDESPRKTFFFHSFNTSKDFPDTLPEVILVIDAINQTSDALSFAEQEAGKYLRRNGGRLTNSVSLAFVTNDGLKKTEPSTDGNALAAVLDRFMIDGTPSGARVTTGELRLRFELSTLQMISIADAEARRPGRKLLIWIGPGWVTPGQANLRNRKEDQRSSLEKFVEMETRLREARISIYSLSQLPNSFGDSEESAPESIKSVGHAEAIKLSLGEIATESGGGVQRLDNDLAGLIDNRVQYAKSFYTLSFDPPASDQVTKYHSLKVVVVPQNLVVRTRTGYFDNPSFPVKFISVGQLAHVVELAHDVSDEVVERQLSGLVLNERLTNRMLSDLKASLRGVKAQQRLIALGDASSFQALPIDERPAKAPPNVDEQRVILSRAVDYLHDTIAKLPNLFTSRTIAHYEDSLQKTERGATTTVNPLWKLVKTTDDVVFYRDGKQALETADGKTKNLNLNAKHFATSGEFGPILTMIVSDAAPNKLVWSHWERGETGLLATFRVIVPKSRSHFVTTYHSAPAVSSDDDISSTFIENVDHIIDDQTGYRGEISIDPESGTIFRLVIMADPEPPSPIMRSDVMVEYGPVEIAGQTYICPVRSVSIAREHAWRADTTFLNDISFHDYHVFRADSYIVPGFTMPKR